MEAARLIYAASPERRRGRHAGIGALALVALALAAPTANAATLAPGDILVGDPNFAEVSEPKVVKVDPVNGAQTVVTSDDQLINPTGATVLGDGDLAVYDPDTAGMGQNTKVLSVKPSDGAQSLLASGGNISTPFDGVLAPGGGLFVADADVYNPGANGKVLLVDPATGAQSIVASGGNLIDPVGIATAANGDLLLADPVDPTNPGPANGQIVRLDPATGVQTVVSAGDSLNDPTSVAEAANGDLFVGDPDFQGAASEVLRIDPATGAQTVVASNLPFPWGIAIDGNGDLIVSSTDFQTGGGSIVRIDPSNGNQTVVTSGGVLSTPFHVTIVRPPAAGPAAGPSTDPPPVISELSVSPSTIAGASRSAAASARRRLTFRYRLSEAALVTFKIDRVTRGRRVENRCRRETRGNRAAPRCRRLKLAGSLAQDGAEGRNEKRFSGRFKSFPGSKKIDFPDTLKSRAKRLRPGSYRATLTAVDRAGQVSQPVSVGFRVIAP